MSSGITEEVTRFVHVVILIAAPFLHSLEYCVTLQCLPTVGKQIPSHLRTMAIQRDLSDQQDGSGCDANRGFRHASELGLPFCALERTMKRGWPQKPPTLQCEPQNKGS